MASNARIELQTRIRDVEELILAHETVTGGGPGRPTRNQGAAITRAGVVLLAAANEAFVEDIFQEASLSIFPNMSSQERTTFFDHTTKRMNTANIHNTDMLFFNLGMSWVLTEISWRGFSNHEFKRSFNKLIEVRGSIAHGRPQSVRLGSLRRWKNMIEIFAVRFEQKVANNIENATGQHPGW